MTRNYESRFVKKVSLAAVASIRMGEMSVAADGEQLRTLLGSCVGLALHDRRQRIGGLAHIVLPRTASPSNRPGKCVDTAIPELIEQMQKVAPRKLELIAKMAGGASMFATTSTGNIGQQNVESCDRLLRELGIPIVARHCGGEQGRRMSLNTASGRVVIEIVGQPPIEL